MFVLGVGGWPLGRSDPNLCRGFSAWESVRCTLRILRRIGTCSATGDGQLAANTTLSSFFKEVGPRHGGSLTPPMADILVDARWSLHAPPFTSRPSSRRRKKQARVRNKNNLGQSECENGGSIEFQNLAFAATTSHGGRGPSNDKKM